MLYSTVKTFSNLYFLFPIAYRQFDLSLHPDDKFFHKSASFYDSNGQLSKSQIMSYLYAGHDISKSIIIPLECNVH